MKKFKEFINENDEFEFDFDDAFNKDDKDDKDDKELIKNGEWLSYAKKNAGYAGLEDGKGDKWNQIEYNLSMAKDISILLIEESVNKEETKKEITALFNDMLNAAIFDWNI